mmetsp:Transcript_10265/g.26514  ORF Transcript_10265/g.26514 Transcript_10265/m.26514 type:complete len:230 (-) Transcript_10265:587-1276(-)
MCSHSFSATSISRTLQQSLHLAASCVRFQQRTPSGGWSFWHGGHSCRRPSAQHQASAAHGVSSTSTAHSCRGGASCVAAWMCLSTCLSNVVQASASPGTLNGVIVLPCRSSASLASLPRSHAMSHPPRRHRRCIAQLVHLLLRRRRQESSRQCRGLCAPYRRPIRAACRVCAHGFAVSPRCFAPPPCFTLSKCGARIWLQSWRRIMNTPLARTCRCVLGSCAHCAVRRR